MPVCANEIAAEETGIRARPSPDCILCGATGVLLHASQPDRLFGAPGMWNSKRCPDPGCGLIWLDPMPLAEDIGKAYANYYTHASESADGPRSILRRWRAAADQNYLRGKFGFPGAPPSIGNRLAGWLLYLTPLRRRNLEVGARFLPWVPGGRLLDVGCGAGAWLGWMRKRGWEVEGVDFDPGAVQAARAAGLPVRCGSVETQSYPAASFDAVTLNHVIEHVPDPVGTLKECARLLKPGGRLVVLTPNGSSLAHKVFRKHWRGLETPRHLHIFSPGSMRRVLNLAGLREVIVRPQIVLSLPYESILLRRGLPSPFPPRDFSARVLAGLFNLAELCQVGWNPSVADCLAAIAVKV